MIELTLARGPMLACFGRRSPHDVVPECALPLAADPLGRIRGVRPTSLFAPQRDAHSLLTRRLHTAVILRPRRVRDGEAKLLWLELPAAAEVPSKGYQAQLKQAEARTGAILSWLPLTAHTESMGFVGESLEQRFVPAQPHRCSWLGELSLVIRSFLEEGGNLRERFSLEGVSAEEIDAFVWHWFEPEMNLSRVLQSTYVDPAAGVLGAFLGKRHVAVQALSCGAALPAVFSETGENQRKRPSWERLGEVLAALVNTPHVWGSTATAAHAPSRNASLGLAPITLQACGAADAAMLWAWPAPNEAFELRTVFAVHKDAADAQLRVPATAEKAFAAVESSDKSWLAKARPLRPELKQAYDAAYQRSLLVLRQMQDEGGGIIAAPEFQFECDACGGYGYCWGRDAGFISLAMDTAGMHQESARFYDYMARCQSADGSFLHRHDMDGSLAPSWGFLQPDETGSVLFGLAEHVRLAGKLDTARRHLPMLERGADWLARPWDAQDLPAAGFDLWEERVGVHYYSVASMAGGLNAARALWKELGHAPKQAWEDAAGRYAKLLASERFLPRGAEAAAPRRTLERQLDAATAAQLRAQGIPVREVPAPHGSAWLAEADAVLDVSMLGAVYPFNALARSAEVDRILRSLLKDLDTALWRPGVGGCGRYEGDRYRGGQPWILTGLWLALAAAALGDEGLARKHAGWSLGHLNQHGFAPEQIAAATGEPAWVMPLTWSHAMVVLALHELPLAVLLPKS